MGTAPIPSKRAAETRSACLQKFRLYETRSNFYIIGRDKARCVWRVLKIDRSESSELCITEDSMTYSESDCCDLLCRIHEGNKSTGGLKFVTTCYGIVGFIKFLGPYYMILVTRRRNIGTICGHDIYAIVKREMIPITNSPLRPHMTSSKIENRYKKLLGTVNLTKDFFFSYSYHAMLSLQKNLRENETGQGHYENMFVWNEFLTREIRTTLQNSHWTIPLVYGFFKQIKLSSGGRDFKLTLFARRSRHYAGTRYLKRGVNEKGRVANDVETEQIVFEDVPIEQSFPISSVVQDRGSIPLFWSQETSRLNIKPDIILSKKDRNYDATRLHFENLVKRYGNPIIILNLIKTREKKPREAILRAEFANAIRVINKGLPEENRLRFLHWDLNGHSGKANNVLSLLGKVATYAVNLTGIFYCQVNPCLENDGSGNWSYVVKQDVHTSIDSPPSVDNHFSSDEKHEMNNLDVDSSDIGMIESRRLNGRQPTVQTGVLRTNCIDCLDRTNVAQYAYGLVALGVQLHALGLVDTPNINLDNPLAEDLMGIYETMGDTLAMQYGGSAAHNKIFCERRGQWKAATQSQEFFRTIQRYYSNAYMDGEKQDAINIFLGHFQPQEGKPTLWELDSDQYHTVGSRGSFLVDDDGRTFIKRSFSDGNLLCESDMILTAASKLISEPEQTVLSESTPEISSCESSLSYASYTPSMPRRQLFLDLEEDERLKEGDHLCHSKHGYASSCSNFVDLDWLSSSGNSCDGDPWDRSIACLSSDNLVNDQKGETASASDSRHGLTGGSQANASDVQATGFSERFVNWVINGELMYH